MNVYKVSVDFGAHKNVWRLKCMVCFRFQVVVHLPGVGCTQAAFQVHIIRPPMHTIGIAPGALQYQVVTVWNWSFTHLTWGHVVMITCWFMAALQGIITTGVTTPDAPFTPLARHCSSISMHTDTDMRVKGSTLPTQRFLLTVSMTRDCQS